MLERRRDNHRTQGEATETITGYKAGKSQLHTGDDTRLAEELNSFYTRFDKYHFSDHQKEVMEEVRCRPSEPVEISQEAVRNCVLKVKTHSAKSDTNSSSWFCQSDTNSSSVCLVKVTQTAAVSLVKVTQTAAVSLVKVTQTAAAGFAKVTQTAVVFVLSK